jgi:hypothetical protein
LNNNTQKNKLLASLKVLKENNQPLESSKEQAKNLKELSESAKDFKRNNINKTGKTQEYFNFSKNTPHFGYRQNQINRHQGRF